MIKIQPRNFNICNRNLAVLFAVFLVAASMLLNDVAYAGYWVKDDAGGVSAISCRQKGFTTVLRLSLRSPSRTGRQALRGVLRLIR